VLLVLLRELLLVLLVLLQVVPLLR